MEPKKEVHGRRGIEARAMKKYGGIGQERPSAAETIRDLPDIAFFVSRRPKHTVGYQ